LLNERLQRGPDDDNVVAFRWRGRIMSEQQMNAISHQFDLMAQRFDQMSQGFADIALRFDQIDQRFDGIDKRFDGIDQRLDGIDQRLDRMDQRFDHVELRLDKLELQFEAHRVDLKLTAEAIRIAQATTNVKLAGLEERLTQRLDPLEALGDNHERRLTRLEGPG